MIEDGILQHCMLQAKSNGVAEHHIRIGASTRTCEVNSIDGEHMLRIREELKIFAKAHSSASPSVGLVLSALYIRKIRYAAEITRFIWPQKNVHTNSERTLSRLERLGLLQLIRQDKARVGEKLLAVPLD